MNYNHLILDMMSWARQAGAIQLQYFRGNDLGITDKLTSADIVTNADKASEQFLLQRIRECYPDHSVLAEESGQSEQEGEYRWVIDPLDGTTNFSVGLPIFAVSIGVEHQGETIAGVVYDAYLDEMFHAIKGQGAFLNGNPIHVSSKQKLEQAVVSTGFPVDKHLTADNNLDNFSRIFAQLRGIRRLGSAAMDMCYVAAGFLDGYWELNLHQWDVCAAALIVSEAGGICTRFRPDRNICMLAATPAIHDQLLPLLSTTANQN